MNNNPKISIIIPAYNEELTIKKVIEGFHNELPSVQIVVIDNNSKDKTNFIANEVLSSIGEKGILLFEKKQGKSNAIRKAFREIDSDIYVMVDADLTYSPKDLSKLLAPVINKEADMVVGDRLSGGKYHKENKRLFHNFGNGLVCTLINKIFKANLNDIMTGYRVFSRDFVKNYPILVEGFELETDMTLYAIQNKFNIVEIPIDYKDRPAGSESKLNTFSDGFLVIRRIISIFKNYKPFLFFGIISFLFFLLSIGCGIPVIIEFIETQYVEHVPLAILSTGLMSLSFLFLITGLILDTIIYRFNEIREINFINSKNKKQDNFICTHKNSIF
jgi:glycosyltransferase involved in cell wall biosynthesis